MIIIESEQNWNMVDGFVRKILKAIAEEQIS